MLRKSRALFQKRHNFRGSIKSFLPLLGLLVIMLARGFGLLQYWEWSAYDWYVKLRPPPPIERRIVIVGYSEADIQKLGKPIMSDRTLATLIEKIRAQQPRAIGLDIYRDLPEPPSYKELAESFKSGDSTQEIADEVLSGYKQLERVFQSTPELVGVWKVGNPEVLPPPTLLKLSRVASVDLIDDGDKVVRRGMLIVTSQSGKNLTSLGLSVALKYLRATSQIQLKFDGDSNVVLGGATFRRFTKNDGGYVGADAGDNQILLDFRPPNSFPVVSVTDVLQDRIRADLFRDRIVLIGPTAESKKDFFFTPRSRELGGFPRQVPGVEIQANLASQILASTLDGRPLIQTWSDPFEYLFILGWGAIAAIVTWQCRRSPNESKRLTFLALASLFCLLLCLLLASVTYLAFVRQGCWLPVVPAFGALVWGTISVILLDYIERERQWRRRLKKKNATLCREKEEKRLALETAEVGIWHWDIARDAVTLSEESVRLFAIADSLLPRTLAEFVELVHAEDRARFKDGLDSLIETSEKNLGKIRIDLQLCVNQLSDIPPYHIAMFVELDKRHRRAIGTIVNRTHVHQEQVAQKKRIEKLDRLLGQSDLAIFALDLHGDITYCTPSVSVIFGYSSNELLGTNIIHLVHPDEQGSLAQFIIYEPDNSLDGQKIHCRLICVNGSALAIELQVFNNLADPFLNCLTLYCWRID